MKCPFEWLRDMGPSAARLCILTSGAGIDLLARAWQPPGGSNFFAGGYVSYATDETDAMMGFTPADGKYVNLETAVDLATAAFMRAHVPGGSPAIGLGVTSSVASTRMHRGDHRVFACVIGESECMAASAVIPKGLGPRHRRFDDELVGELSAHLLSLCLGGSGGLDPAWLQDGDGTTRPTFTLQHVAALAHERLMLRPFFRADGTRSAALARVHTSLVFPGAFNPPHAGHFDAADAARAEMARTLHVNGDVVYSTTVDPPHKPALSTVDVLKRAKALRGRDFLATSGDPLYIDKARRMPGAAFVMGADALDRMLDPKWCPVEPMLDEFERLGTRLLVPGRIVGDTYQDAGSVCAERQRTWIVGRIVVPVEFRLDVSSTQLRADGAAK